MNLFPARNPGESQKSYRARQAANKAAVKMHLRGSVFWDSSQGTYRRFETKAKAAAICPSSPPSQAVLAAIKKDRRKKAKAESRRLMRLSV